MIKKFIRILIVFSVLLAFYWLDMNMIGVMVHFMIKTTGPSPEIKSQLNQSVPMVLTGQGDAHQVHIRVAKVKGQN